MKTQTACVIILVVNAMKFGTIEPQSSNLFVKSKQVASGPQRLARGWVEKSIVACAAQCRKRFSKKCLSFMYNALTQLCTPSYDLISFCPQPTDTEGVLYVCNNCKPHPKFSDYTNGSTVVSYLYVTEPLSYSDASAACNELNSHLFVPDTLEKLKLFYAAVDLNYETWIGLDDTKVEGKFVWADTGLEIDPGFKKVIFSVMDPDNYNNQDCVQYYPNMRSFDDDSCAKSKRYVCERNGC